MTVKGRMKGILEKQTAADRAREAEEARLAVVEKDAAALRSRIEQKWVELSAVLTETIMSANNAMTGGRKLHVAHEIMPKGSLRISEVTFSFENKPPNLVHRKCYKRKCGWNDFRVYEWRRDVSKDGLSSRRFNGSERANRRHRVRLP